MDLTEVTVEATFGLRSGVLGWAEPATRIDDGTASHLALVDGTAVIAVVSHARWPCPDAPEQPARYFWAMAVDGAHRGRGAGRRLLAAVADRARSAGESILWADARASAVGFYVACGARVVGPPYVDEVTGLTDRRVLLPVDGG
ncbi:GNAT family N-acetyltransferase [Jidongwangia harbinensis]|uniref:GNAT family N-acetyltransferase n=1 Tax=Jidongwangia harbinensis TaxID=2878561 RepID=UPI001CD9A470|nr:GNAT family N-acetyltransferase [Jidongwangia harbinensis]MCA2217837.1 GNAT family N-acetyltransferase [Jidongwangia harbinensis]